MIRALPVARGHIARRGTPLASIEGVMPRPAPSRPLDPDAPQPGSPRSSTTTDAPDSASSNAAANPE